MTVKVVSATRTATAKKSSRNPRPRLWPMSGMAKVLENRSPYASMIVNSRMMKPQNMKKWARPGTGRRSNLRWPKTSIISALIWAPDVGHPARGRLAGRHQAEQEPCPPRHERRARRRSCASPIAILRATSFLLALARTRFGSGPQRRVTIACGA